MDLRTKVLKLDTLKHIITSWKMKGNSIVFTNGCFDILHQGHLHILRESKMLGDKLVVGLNSNTSVSKLKGEKRPIKDEAIRAEILAALTYVDAVIIFEEETPKELIEAIEIDILVKGSDYKKADIVGSNFVETNGGKTVIVPLIEGISSSILIEQM